MSLTTLFSVIEPAQLILFLVGGLVVIISVFGVLAVIISMLNYEANPVKERLQQFKEHGTFEGAGQKKSGLFDDLKELIMNLAAPISNNLYGQNEKYKKEVKLMLTEAGLHDNEDQIIQFLTQRAAVGLVAGAIGFAVSLLLAAGNVIWMGAGGLGGFMLGSMIPQFILKNQAGKRKTEIRFKLPDTLDLMVVCVEAGLGLDATIQRVADETEKMAGEISHEFKRLNKELNAGISRIDAFQNMGQRSGVDEMRSLCAMIVQADKMGTSVADTLRIYADDLRTKRRQRAEELASKASIKMTFPLVLFIFPPLFIILMGPIVINSIAQFFPAGK